MDVEALGAIRFPGPGNDDACGTRSWGSAPEDFTRMLAERRADTVVVTSVDRTHDRYIIGALGLRRGDRETVDRRRTAVPGDPQRPGAYRSAAERLLQLPVRPAQRGREGADHLRRDRRRAVGTPRMAARHAAPGGLLPALASRQAQLRRADGSQGESPLRSGGFPLDLVADPTLRAARRGAVWTEAQ